MVSTLKYKVTFLPANRVVEAEPNSSLIKAARQAGLHINASCGGAGVCGKCRVLLEKGSLEGGTSEKMSAEDIKIGYRQACIAQISSDLTIRIPESSSTKGGVLETAVPQRHQARMHEFDIASLKKEGIFSPPVEKVCLELTAPGPHDNRADVGRLIQGLADQYDLHRMVTGLSVLRKIRRALREKDFLVTVTVGRPVNEKFKSHLLNIQSGNWTNRNFGLAFDIGTTTVYGQLIDLNSGKIVAEAGDYNAQISYGEDVISRIIYAEKSKGLEKMHDLVTGTINKLIKRLLKLSRPPVSEQEQADKGYCEIPITWDELNSITIAANTTMTHLFLKLEPDNIRRAPYIPVSTFFPPFRASDLGLELPSHTVALMYPAISSYVGGDIVAGVMGSGMYRTDLVTLYIDIGTNAEIVIGNNEWLVCAACSAGPAFEGGGITHGMRAAVGAIEDFSLDPVTLEPMNLTIGNKPPVGICGSGLLILIAALFEQRVINQDGKFNHIDNPRVRQGKSGFEYVLAWEENAGVDHDIVINEVDIDNFIRAKAAIFAGVKTLVEEVGLQLTEIEQIIMAGAFGSYIDLDSAMTVGLLPEVDPEKVLYVGNGSLLGARMSELSNHIRRDVVNVVRKMTSFELSEVASFKDQYMASLFLPHTDMTLFPEVGKRLGGNNSKDQGHKG